MTAEDLARELSSIETACGRDDGDAPGDPLCLLRVVEGLAPETWRRIQRELSLSGWRAATPAELARGGGIPPLAGDGLFHELILEEMARARACRQPFALALVEPDPVESLATVQALVRAQIRRFDRVVPLRGGSLGVLLSASPLDAAERAMASMLRRIRQVSEPDIVCSAGLIGYGGLAEVEPDALLDRARQALEEARRLGGNRLEVGPSADAVLASRATLVRASEKYFLFTGKKLPE